jgi:hypothetical protein
VFRWYGAVLCSRKFRIRFSGCKTSANNAIFQNHTNEAVMLLKTIDGDFAKPLGD